MSISECSFTSDNQLPPSATSSPEKPVNGSLGSDPLTLELEVIELAQKLDVVKFQMCIVSEYKLMQPTLKSIPSAQNQIFNRLAAPERVVHCTPHRGTIPPGGGEVPVR